MNMDDTALEMANAIQTSWSKTNIIHDIEGGGAGTIGITCKCHFCDGYEDYTMSSQAFNKDGDSVLYVQNQLTHDDDCVVPKADEYCDDAMAELMAIEDDPSKLFDADAYYAQVAIEAEEKSRADAIARMAELMGGSTPSRSRKSAISNMDAARRNRQSQDILTRIRGEISGT